MFPNRFVGTSLLLVVGLLSNAHSAAQVTSEQIDELANQCLQKFEVPGIAVGVVKDGKVVHARGYGVASIQSDRSVDEQTRFAIASNTKAFTTAALAILVDRRKLSWNDKVVDHIPEFKMYSPYVTANFTIEDLLTHRSGLGLGVGDLMFFPDGSDFEMEDVLASFQHFKPQTPFRTRFDYDNLLYIVAGEVIARASGMSWDDFVTREILEPLGMDETRASIRLIEDRSNVAVPHSTETGPIKVLPHFEEKGGICGSAGSIQSSVSDLCRWMLVQLNEGRYGEDLEQRLFSQTRQREMWRIHTTLPAEVLPTQSRYNTHFFGYGLGWMLSDVSGNLCAEHTGGLPGMLSRTVLIPDQELGVIVLTNSGPDGGYAFDAISHTIIDSYLGLDDNDWVGKFQRQAKQSQSRGDAVTKRVWEQVEANRDLEIDLDPYTGMYEDPWFGRVEITNQDGQLHIRCLRSPKLTGLMHHYHANSFAIRWDYRDMNADAFASFALDERGRAESIKMKGISPNIDFSFDFHDLDLRRTRR